MPKQRNETDLQYKQRVIDTKSASFCAAKWYNATIWLGSGMTTSCHHPLPHKVSEKEVTLNPKALHNTPQKKLERKQMQRGERPSGCEYCWKIEDIGRDNISDRVYKTVIYKDEDLESAFKNNSDLDVNLKTLEIAFDRTCQFACSYCNPAFSSTWVKDIKKHGAYQNLISDGRNHFTHTHDSAQLYTIHQTNPYVEAFFKWWETDLHKTLDELRITGGEPLMSGYTWQLLDWYKNNKGKSNTRLAINSNLGINEKQMDEFVEKIQGLNVDLYTSMEAMHQQAEYIRDGLDFKQWLENVRFLIESSSIKALHIMCTINALCLDSLPQFLELVMDLKQEYGKDFPNFTLNILRFPSFQSPLVLPDNLKELYRSNLIKFYNKHQSSKYFHDHEISHLQRLIDYLDVVKTPHSEAFDKTKLLNDFKQFYSQYDQRRNKNLETTFPNLKDWYNTL